MNSETWPFDPFLSKFSFKKVPHLAASRKEIILCRKKEMSSSGVLGTSQLAADERKRKRMISNRESAKRSRERKRQQMDDQTNQVAQLQLQNGQIEMQVNLWKQQWLAVESENRLLRAQLNELSKRLQWLNSMLGITNEMDGIAVDSGPEMPDLLLQPWQLPCPPQMIMADAHMSRF